MAAEVCCFPGCFPPSVLPVAARGFWSRRGGGSSCFCPERGIGYLRSPGGFTARAGQDRTHQDPGPHQGTASDNPIQPLYRWRSLGRGIEQQWNLPYHNHERQDYSHVTRGETETPSI